MTRKLNLFLLSLFIHFFFISNVYANSQEKIFNKLKETETLSFDFIQKIEGKEEIGNCFIKYPLLMRCDYENLKKKSIISNGKTLAIIKKKYKKIYYYPLKSTPLFIILQKEKILNLIKNNQPKKNNKNFIEYEFSGKKNKNLKIFFDRNSFNLKGWETIDAYSNVVNFKIINLETNILINNDFFKIPAEKDL